MAFKGGISSTPFRFLVGPEKKLYTLHSALVASQSLSLNALVNGKMKEAQQSCADWAEVDEDTFVYFGEFVYYGDYGNCATSSSLNQQRELELLQEHRRIYMASPAPRIPKKRSCPGGSNEPVELDEMTGLYKDFVAKKHDMSSAKQPTAKAEEATVDAQAHAHVHAHVHAKVFVFADYHGIPELEILALRKLRHALMRLELDESGVKALIQLLQYSYDNTMPSDGASPRGSSGDLRDLVVVYCTCKAKTLTESAEFNSFLRNRGDITIDILHARLGKHRKLENILRRSGAE